MTDALPATELWARAQEVFLDALDQPTGERADWVRQACDGDLVLRDEVLSFLGAHQEGGPLGEWDGPRPATGHPERIGAHRILREIGVGGMGTVYLAEREGNGFRQRVALKLLRAGWADPRLEDRMARERAILARLEHPGIARLVDGGVSDAGQPWLAMEYVEGTGLLRYAREHQLTVRERLRLFLQVCDAVSYAHQQLVVHRDLKPGNIIVGVDGRVRLLDFGIAVLVDPDERQAGMTQTAAWLTPAYASPEQVRGDRVSTLSDVYALGVLLYELLADARPYECDARSPAQVEALVCHTMPPRPSSRAHTPRLRRQLRGDLDTIVLCAMAKEPSRRYGSAAALADDIRRHLDGLPVLARPAGIVYRTTKFLRRHAVAVVSSVLVMLSLVAGAWIAARQAERAERERDAATREAERASQMNALLVELFRMSDPTIAPDGRATPPEALLHAATHIEREFRNQPDVQAALHLGLGAATHDAARFVEADAHYAEVLARADSAGGRAHPAAAAALLQQGLLRRLREEYRAAEPLLRGAAAMYAELYEPGHPDRLGAGAEYLLCLIELGRFSDAEALAVEVMPVAAVALGGDHPTTGKLREAYANLLAQTGRVELAVPIMDTAIAVKRQRHGGDHPELVITLVRAAEPLLVQGSLVAAGERFAEARAMTERLSGERGVYWMLATSGLGRVALARGDVSGAAQLFEEAAEVAEERLRPGHRYRLALDRERARLDLARGDLAAARERLVQVLAGERAVRPAGHPRIVEGERMLAEAEGKR